MENQKICIIGGGLSGLITALSLSKLKITIDLVTGNIKENLISNLCERNRRLITLEEIYERVGAQTALEKNGVLWGVRDSKDALRIMSTSVRGTYRVC